MILAKDSAVGGMYKTKTKLLCKVIEHTKDKQVNIRLISLGSDSCIPYDYPLEPATEEEMASIKEAIKEIRAESKTGEEASVAPSIIPKKAHKERKAKDGREGKTHIMDRMLREKVSEEDILAEVMKIHPESEMNCIKRTLSVRKYSIKKNG